MGPPGLQTGLQQVVRHPPTLGLSTPAFATHVLEKRNWVDAARFNEPIALALDAVNDLLYIADRSNAAIRVLNLGTMQVSTLAGLKGTSGFADSAISGTAVRFNMPIGLALDVTRQWLFVADVACLRRRVLLASSAPA